MNTSHLQKLLQKHRDVDVCFNNNGIKIGLKGTDQKVWKRFGWKEDVSINHITELIKEIKKPSQKTFPAFSDEESSDSGSDSDSSEMAEMGASVQKYLTGISSSQMADIKSLISFAKKQGYVKKDASLADLKNLVKTWAKNK